MDAGHARRLLLALALAALLVAAPTVTAQQSDTAGAAGNEQAADPPAFDEAMARQAHRVAENWVQRRSVPSETIPIRATGVAAVHATIRNAGPTVGQGTAAADRLLPSGEGSAPPNNNRAADVMNLVRNAVANALAGVSETLGAAADQTGSLTLDLQFAAPPQRLRLEALSDLPGKIKIGVHGMALRRGGERAWVFPGNMIAANTTLKGQINRLMSQLQIPLAQIQRIGTEQGPKLYRFPAIHVVRPAPDQPTAVLHRGNELLRRGALDDAGLRGLRRLLRSHLLGRQRDDGRFAGTYHPSPDRYEPSVARPQPTALTAYALARLAKLPGLPIERAKPAADAARRALQALDRADRQARAGRQPLVDQLGPTATALLAVLETPSGAEMKAMRDRLASALRSMQGAEGRFRTRRDPQSRPAPGGLQARAAAAMAELYDLRRTEQALRRARNALGAAWDRLGSEDLSVALPWLVHAELRLARLGHGTAHRTKLADRCRKLWRKQRAPWDAAADRYSPDTYGGFALPGGLTDTPDWQSGPVLAGQTLLPRFDGLVDKKNERIRWLTRCGLGARFLAQLTMQRPSCYYTRNTQRALGGVRLAFWNNHQTLAATASALLAVVELEHTLHRLSAQ